MMYEYNRELIFLFPFEFKCNIETVLELRTLNIKYIFHLCDVTPRRPLKVNRRFDGTCRLHLYDGILIASSISYFSVKMEATCSSETVDVSTDYGTLYPRRQNCSAVGYDQYLLQQYTPFLNAYKTLHKDFLEPNHRQTTDIVAKESLVAVPRAS
jgi:hypothetical protein